MTAILGTLPYGTAYFTDDQRRRHMSVVGQTGTGKSTFLLHLMMQDFLAERPFAFLDPHGDSAQSITDAAPPHLRNRIVYLDPLDPTHAVGFNPLHNVPVLERSKTTAHVVSSLKHIYADSWGPRLEYILLNCIRLLLDNHATLLHIIPLLTREDFRDRCVLNSTDPFVSSFWTNEYDKWSERYRGEAIPPIQNKIGQFAISADLRSIIGHRSTIRIPRIMNDGRYLICNLSKRMGQEPSHLLGALLTTAFAQAAEARATIPEEERPDFTLYVDEFQNFATDSFAAILSEARKWRLNLVLANQYVTQLPDSLRAAVFGNIGTLVVFRVGAEDAPILAKQLGHTNPANLIDTSNYQAWLRQAPSLLSPMHTIRPQLSTGSLQRVIAWTRGTYARPRQQIEEDIHSLVGGGDAAHI